MAPLKQMRAALRRRRDLVLWMGGRDLAVAMAVALAAYVGLAGMPPSLLLRGSDAAAALDASDLARRLLEQAAESSTMAGRGTVEALVRVAELYRRQGHQAEALAYLTRARLLLERAVGSRHEDIAPILDRLAVVSLELGDLQQAAAFEDRAIMIRTAAYGVDDPRVALNLEDLADVKMMEGRLDEAMRLARRVLALRQRTVGDRGAYVARALGRIGAIYREGGNLRLADLYLKRALELIGPDVLHARVDRDSGRTLLTRAREAARILTEAGVLRSEQGRYGAARRLLVCSFQLYTGQFDAAARQAEVLWRLAETYRREGRYRMALTHLRISLRLSQEVPRSPAAEARIREARDTVRREAGMEQRASRRNFRSMGGAT